MYKQYPVIIRVISVFLLVVGFMPGDVTAEVELKDVVSKYDVQLYGKVKFDMQYDTAEFRNYNDFLGTVGAGLTNGNDSTNFNPRDTRLGFIINSKEGEVWDSKAVAEMDFYGDNNGNNIIPRLRLGYVKATNKKGDYSILMGQDWIPVSALNPPTIDFGVMAAGGNLWWRIPQVTLRKNFDNIELLLSAMKHRRISTAEDDRMPWLLGKLSTKFDGGYIGLGGGYRKVDYTAADGGTEDLNLWMATIELKKSFGRMTFMAEPWIGAGLDKEWLRYDLGINPNDMSASNPEAISSWGGWASLSYNATENTTFSIGYGIDDPKDEDLAGVTLNDRQFTKNQYAFINTWYKLTEAIKVGGEFIYIDTERDTASDDGMRFTFSTIYAF